MVLLIVKRITLLPCIIFFVMFALFLIPINIFSAEKGPFFDSVRFIHYLDENIALEEVKSGKLDTYYFRIPLETANSIQNDPNLKIYSKVSGTFGILFNPAPINDQGEFNPFESREVRFAMNFLINREFISNEIMKGYAIPLFDPFGIYAPEYQYIIDIIESYNFRYDPEFAAKIINEKLSSLNATKINGKWYYNNTVVTIKFLIRSDDPLRKSIGEVVTRELENLGFNVIKEYADLNKANNIISGTNPQDFQWHLYTEGFFGTSEFVNFNPTVLAQMYSPWYTYMPGKNNPMFWSYTNNSLDVLTQKLVLLNYTDVETRNELLRNSIKMGIQESVRIFLVKNIDPFVTSSSLSGLINDFGAGITSKYSLINIHPNQNSSKKQLNVGVKQIYQGAWNSIGGFQDLYSRDIYSAVSDSSTYRHPYTGEITPLRVLWENVTTFGPLKKIKLPEDTKIWNSVNQDWTNVDNKSSSFSKITSILLYSNWHHGIPMDISDILYSLYFMFEWGTNTGENDSTVDSEYTSRASVGLPLFKGFRLISDNKIETYIDQWNIDKNEIAASGSIWVSEPWEITAATERLVQSNVLSYSKSDSSSRNTDWMSLIIKEHAFLIRNELKNMIKENYIPPALKNMVTLEQAIKRYQTSIDWIESHKHAIISNGPFFLDNYNPSGRVITIKAFRDPTYPFEVGKWSLFEHPNLATISKVKSDKFLYENDSLITKILVNNANLSSVDVKYFLYDSNGIKLISGNATYTSSNSDYNYSFIIPSKYLKKGSYSLKIFAISSEALKPDIYYHTLLVRNN